MNILQEKRFSNNRNKFITSIFILVLMSLMFAGCSNNKTKTVNGLYFDTFISISVYDNTDVEVLNKALEKCKQYELIFSRTNNDSELYAINNRFNNISDTEGYKAVISEDMYRCMEQCLYYADKTYGAYNPTLGTVIDLWDYHSDNPEIPSEADIKEALKSTSPNSIKLTQSTDEKDEYYIEIADNKVKIDLGGAAKGYIANELVSFLKECNCKEAIIALGGNIYCIGNKNGNKYSVGIQKPFASKGEIIKNLKVADTSVVSSGIYERYFEKNGNIYHHIIDGTNGFPVNNDLQSVTVISDDSLKADILSTAFLCMGSEGIAKYVEKDSSVGVIIIDKNNIITEIGTLVNE